jgi:8-oxo-dGTP pyrophosphatase MutT (NUDIX family)
MSAISLKIVDYANRFEPFEVPFHSCVVDSVRDALQQSKAKRSKVADSSDAEVVFVSPAFDHAARAVTLTVHASADGDGVLPLWHDPRCEARTGVYADVSVAKNKQTWKLAACALLEQKVGVEPAVLLTQRAPRMRLNAGAFVVPGGHFDATDANVTACALRELNEETGITVEPDCASPFALYEAVYERSHYLIVYVLAKLDAVEREQFLVPPSEVSAVLWLPRSRVEESLEDAVAGAAEHHTVPGLRVPDSARDRRRLARNCARCTDAAVCGADLDEVSVPLAALRGDETHEGIAFGTRLLLRHWSRRQK